MLLIGCPQHSPPEGSTEEGPGQAGETPSTAWPGKGLRISLEELNEATGEPEFWARELLEPC